MKSIRAHLRANAVAYVALFFALGGTAFALGANTVGSKQIKNRSVKGADLAKNAVSSAKVRNGSLLGADFAVGQLPQGPAGPQGATGPQGSPDTAQQVLDKVKQVDGGGSGLDADTLDGRDAAQLGSGRIHAVAESLSRLVSLKTPRFVNFAEALPSESFPFEPATLKEAVTRAGL